MKWWVESLWLSTTSAATSASLVMAWLIVGMAACTGIRAEALSIFENGRGTARFAVAPWAGALHGCCRHELITSTIFLTVD